MSGRRPVASDAIGPRREDRPVTGEIGRRKRVSMPRDTDDLRAHDPEGRRGVPMPGPVGGLVSVAVVSHLRLDARRERVAGREQRLAAHRQAR